MKKKGEVQSVSAITYRVDCVSKVKIEERLHIESLTKIMINFASDITEDYDEWVDAFEIFE